MEADKVIEVQPADTYFWLIMWTLFDGDDAVNNFFEQNPNCWALDATNYATFKSFLRHQLMSLYEQSNRVRPLGIKYDLQYLLNIDEFTPYKTNQHRPELKSKEGSLAQIIRNSCQDTITPYDGYMLCEWMWESLFGDEDWHTDISNWVVVEPKPYVIP
jgi:hypothetical protein